MITLRRHASPPTLLTLLGLCLLGSLSLTGCASTGAAVRPEPSTPATSGVRVAQTSVRLSGDLSTLASLAGPAEDSDDASGGEEEEGEDEE